MKILHVITGIDSKTGGPANALTGLGTSLLRQGAEVSLVCMFTPWSNQDQGKLIEDAGGSVHLIGPTATRLKRHPDIKPTLNKLISGHDIVHVHGMWEEIIHQAATISRKLGKPYLFTPHGMLDPWSLSQSKWIKKIYMFLRTRRDLNGASAIHYTAEQERNLAAPLGLKPQAIIEPNGLDLSEFATLPERNVFRSKFPIVGDRRIILFLSRIHKKKGLDLLLPAWASIKRDDSVLVIAGPDNDGYGETLKSMVAEYHLEKDVVLTGMLRGRDRIEAFTAAELFVLPSYQENFGIVVVEALACGCPVIITDAVDIHHEISTAGVGKVVPTRVDRLAEVLAGALNDPSQWIDARDRARPFALTTYDWNAIAKKWMMHYQALVDCRRV